MGDPKSENSQTLHQTITALAQTTRRLAEMRNSSRWHEETAQLPRAAQLSIIRVLRETSRVCLDLAANLEDRVRNYGRQRDD
jgi:hypothetical protein